MKTTMPNMPKHKCPTPGNQWIGFAPLDADVMQALVERNASTEEIKDQVKFWIATDAAKNPNPPTETADKRFHAALLSTAPFALYCGRCLEPICFVHPEQMRGNELI